ncbi:MAG: hypothetical protein FJY76_02420 [Candidatus Aenigmarchaeota archaeon]|nr:hypothetical protein [Candidatus Aenigmarchaeota archaeon]
MALRKVESYGVVEREGGIEPLGTMAGGLLLGIRPAGYKLRLDLDDGRRFLMHNIAYDILDALKRSGEEHGGDIYDVLREASGRGMNPFRPIRGVYINAECDEPSCAFASILRRSDLRAYGKPLDIIFCKEGDFRSKAESGVVLEDGYAMPLKDPAQGFWAGAIYGCDINVNGRNVRNFLMGIQSCSMLTGTSSAAMDVEGTERTPMISGFGLSESVFLLAYDFARRSHPVDSAKAPDDFRFDAPSFLRRAIKNGCNPRRFVINGVDEDKCYVAEAITNRGRIRMIPSHAFLISRVSGRDAFVDDKLVEQQDDG